MQEPQANAANPALVVDFARKLEAFAQTLDEQEQQWLAELVQAAVDAAAARAEAQEYNMQDGATALETAGGTPQSNLNEGLLGGVPSRLDNPPPPAATVGPAAVNYVNIVFG